MAIPNEKQLLQAREWKTWKGLERLEAMVQTEDHTSEGLHTTEEKHTLDLCC